MATHTPYDQHPTFGSLGQFFSRPHFSRVCDTLKGTPEILNFLKTGQVKSSFLEYFYQHVTDFDWSEGLELYQTGCVSSLEDYSGLIMGKVNGPIDRKKEDVRLKIHPSGKNIQWIECTCRRNRIQGYYCEHITAFMIAIDRDKSNIFKNLDSKAPIKAPTVVRRGTKEAGTTTPKAKKTEGATESILQSFTGAFHNVQLVGQGPFLRIKLELKEGELTHYDLGVDAAARFLQTNPQAKENYPALQKLKVHETPVSIGSWVRPIEEEKLQVERVYGLVSSQAMTGAEHFEAKAYGSEDSTPEPQLVNFFSAKLANKYAGKDFFFVPDYGYFPLEASSAIHSWHEQALKKTYKDDDAAQFCERSYEPFLGLGTLWLAPELPEPHTLQRAKISTIQVLKEEAGWFYLDPKYQFTDQSFSMLEMLDLYRNKKRKYLKKGNSWVQIPEFIRQQDWELTEDGQSLKVDALGLLRLKAQIGEFDEYAGSKELLNKIREATEFHPAGVVPELSHTKLNLREYQLEGVEWLWWLYRNRLHGLLADEMGLGKTHQAMGLLSAIQTEGDEVRILIVAPTTVLDHWQDKVDSFCPQLAAYIHHGPKRSRKIQSPETGPLTIITSYGILLRDIKEFSTLNWSAIILDEAHMIKNSDTASYQAVCKIKARIRLCLSGTPIENHLGELKNIFDFLVPGYLGSDEYFRKTYLNPINDNDKSQEHALQKLIHPFKMRRTKEQVLSDLPAKVEDIRHTSLSDQQARMYKEVIELKAQPLIKKLKDDNESIPYLHVFAVLSLLKQICDHPCLVNNDPNYEAHKSNKFELLKDLFSEAIASDHKIVIYSQYLGMIKIISDYLSKNAIDHVTLTGQSKQRGKIIERFQTNPQCKVFVGSLLAGGIGIDLTAANMVIHYDRWWNASKENQATDRVHRFGQQKNVQVIKMVTRGTLEEKIDLLISSKQSLFERFMDQDEEIFKSFSREELISLFI